MAPKLYPVLSPISSDKRYEIGEMIPLEDSQVAELKFYGAIGEATVDALQEGKLKAADLIDKIKTAATAEEVDAILGDDARATVVAAAVARKAELAG